MIGLRRLGETMALFSLLVVTCLAAGDEPVDRNGAEHISRTSPTRIKAFPTAEGYGAYSKGGRPQDGKGEVVHVTNLFDLDEMGNTIAGSLRAAVELNRSEHEQRDPPRNAIPRIIVFDVAGTINLDCGLQIWYSNLSIEGATAPGDGICIVGSMGIGDTREEGARPTISSRSDRCQYNNIVGGEVTRSVVRNVIVRHLRFRLPGCPPKTARDCLNVQLSHDIIFDHCSFSWASDTNVDVVGGSDNITFQWCIFSEGLDDCHKEERKPRHSTGLRFSTPRDTHVSVHHNLFAHNGLRNPRIKGRKWEEPGGKGNRGLMHADVRNNVVYNWRGRAFQLVAEDVSTVWGNYVNNLMIAGSDTEDTEPIEVKGPDKPTRSEYFVKGYINGNYLVKGQRHSVDGLIKAGGRYFLVDKDYGVTAGHEVRTVHALHAELPVLSYAGAGSSLKMRRRDSVDKRIVRDVINRTGRIKKQKTGDWPEYDLGRIRIDSDSDGMPDVWELDNGLDPTKSSDFRGDNDRDGYTNIEEYLHQLELDAKHWTRMRIPD